MKQYFTGTFFKFLFGFLAIIGVAFVVLVFTSSKMPLKPVDIIAQPK